MVLKILISYMSPRGEHMLTPLFDWNIQEKNHIFRTNKANILTFLE